VGAWDVMRQRLPPHPALSRQESGSAGQQQCLASAVPVNAGKRRGVSIVQLRLVNCCFCWSRWGVAIQNKRNGSGERRRGMLRVKTPPHPAPLAAGEGTCRPTSRLPGSEIAAFDPGCRLAACSELSPRRSRRWRRSRNTLHSVSEVGVRVCGSFAATYSCTQCPELTRLTVPMIATKGRGLSVAAPVCRHWKRFGVMAQRRCNRRR